MAGLHDDALSVAAVAVALALVIVGVQTPGTELVYLTATSHLSPHGANFRCHCRWLFIIASQSSFPVADEACSPPGRCPT